ncbi:MAG: VCBS repeat-containing protein [Candidatus Acidiferrales bacterium]
MSAATYLRRNVPAFAVLLLSLLVALTAGSASAQSNRRSTAPTSGHPGLPFAIADFDGDHLPDVATVEGGYTAASVADYSIRFSLSGSGSLSIPLIAPAGGLSVEARDVNGDDAPDLIVATMWQRQPVAVFLNDGHGSFSRVETSKFESSFDSSSSPIASAPGQQPDGVASLAPETAGFCALLRATSDHQPHFGRITKPTAVIASHEFLGSHSGRAPPSEVSSL